MTKAVFTALSLAMPAAALHALLEHAIDYAGLFPPAELQLQPALENQATYIRSPERWMLGTFILPIARFDEARRLLNRFSSEFPLAISVLGPKTATVEAFRETLERSVEAVQKFAAAQDGAIVMEQFEMPLPPAPIRDLLDVAGESLGQLRVRCFWEAPVEMAATTIEALAGRGAGFKLRTGGVTADAFPGGGQIAHALVAAARHRVPIKFTAGLHHPVRLFHSSVGTKMHGFLNVLGTGVLAAEHGWSEAEAEELLAEEDPRAFTFTDDEFCWRNWKIPTARIVEQRHLIRSLGSCSFDEPREDLRALRLLEKSA